jgi:hypothetical protein
MAARRHYTEATMTLQAPFVNSHVAEIMKGKIHHSNMLANRFFQDLDFLQVFPFLRYGHSPPL